jgi:hypothetical protein
MEYDLFTAELEAIQSLNKLVEQARECRQLHERANMPVPELLRRMFAMNGQGDRKVVALIRPPETPPRPREADSDWISISVKDAYATSMVLALLRDADGPIPPKAILAQVHEIRADIPSGTIYNLGARLDGTSIKRSDEGWELLTPTTAPILQGDLVWGASDFFSKQELAAHRRDAILHVLGIYPTGQQISQLIEMLKNCAWLKAPVNKELVQDDIEILRKDGKVKRRGNTRKWELVDKPDNNGPGRRN